MGGGSETRTPGGVDSLTMVFSAVQMGSNGQPKEEYGFGYCLEGPWKSTLGSFIADVGEAGIGYPSAGYPYSIEKESCVDRMAPFGLNEHSSWSTVPGINDRIGEAHHWAGHITMSDYM